MSSFIPILALALQLCPWKPAEIPSILLVEDTAYERIAEDFGLPKSVAILNKDTYIVYMKRSTANERILCHEFRHIVDPEWKHR